MATITIRKESALVWNHIPSDQVPFIIGKFTFHIDGDDFQVIELGQSKRNLYNFADVTIYDATTNTTYNGFTSASDLSLQLEALAYIGFDLTSGIPEAPQDGQTYGRKDGGWVVVSGGGSGFTPYNIKITYTAPFTVPTGLTVNRVVNLNDIYTDYTANVVGTTLTIGDAVIDDVYLIDGYFL